MQCTDCGQEFENEGRRRKLFCLDCSWRRAHEAAKQMASKDGPYYDRWLLAKDKAVRNFRAGIERTIKRYEESLSYEEYLATPMGQAEMLIRYGSLRNALEDFL